VPGPGNASTNLPAALEFRGSPTPDQDHEGQEPRQEEGEEPEGDAGRLPSPIILPPTPRPDALEPEGDHAGQVQADHVGEHEEKRAHGGGGVLDAQQQAGVDQGREQGHGHHDPYQGRGEPGGECEGAGAPGAIHAPFYVHDQPTNGAFRELDRYSAQILLWEDDVWYLELLFFPPSLADAYKVITTTIAGPTTRWQMMRHWNVINPGDHDYGMDDVKGPEQLLLRKRDDLGQDPDYMRRNFQIVAHLSRGIAEPDPMANPQRWRAWTMPDNDFSILVLDSRLWRSSQDTDIWDDSGWGHVDNLYSRRDPTRTLLGEEQFAWLANQIRTNPAPHICVTGLNALHTIWGGWDGGWADRVLERDRVSADYAGWVAAASTRVLELLSERDGVVSVYGDVHAGSIIRNKDLRLYECSFGPIGRWGSRSLVAGFGRDMRDNEGRDLECVSLYHHRFENPELDRLSGPEYWNFLEMVFDPTPAHSSIYLALRNIIDGPEAVPRGGGFVQALAVEMGRPPTSRLPDVAVLGNACVVILRASGEPIRGLKSDGAGRLSSLGLVGVPPDETLTIVAHCGDDVEAHTVRTMAP